ncbi:MAG TPA: RNA methyltransferase [Acidobacteriaceae bacterium]|nr:RNA methyltransferase [Acidobacteriaceae bacterium]
MPASTITSRANPRVKQLRAAFSGNARLAEGLVAIEGENLMREAMRSGIALRMVFASEETSEPEWLPHGIEVVHLSGEIFASAVDTQSPQGLAALIEPPQWNLESVLRPHAAPLFLIAAGLQDPGNLGTLVRSAEAFAASAVLTTPGTVSPWNQKALRASAGSVFRMPVVSVNADDLARLNSRGVQLLAAVASGATTKSASVVDLTRPTAVMIGNEGSGLTDDLLALADGCVSIPTPGPVESLNAAVAGSLLLYEASRQRLASQSTAGN